MNDTTILVIDDNQFILWLIRDILQKHGYRIRTASSGREGLRIAHKEHPDLIILDRILRDVSGDSILQHLKGHEDTRHVPIAMLSSVNNRQKVMESWSMGANDYIVKPFTIDTLTDKVRRMLAIYDQGNQKYYFV